MWQTGLVITVSSRIACRSLFWTLRVCFCWLQDSDFLYLTGIDQQAVAVVEASSPMREANFTLYIPDTDPQVHLPCSSLALLLAKRCGEQAL